MSETNTYQLWHCESGCGHEFLWKLSKPRKHRPLCPNCGTKHSMVSKGMVTAEPVRVDSKFNIL
jgi:NAD-dependent SIR2 family protein deacetylase